MFDLNGKNALITGASGGIGAAIARLLHNRGANVILSGTQIERLNSLSEELGERAIVIAANLSDKEAANDLAKTAQDQVGVIDVLINNAGLTRDNLAMRMSDEDWQLVLDVNLSAAFRLSKSVLRLMMKNRWGRIINVTSVVGSIGNPGQINYASSKSGLTGMTKALAQEVASRGITVNCVSPGFIDTAMTDALNDNQKAEILSRIPAACLGTPEDVSACVLFLASEESSYVTGQTIHVNGGMAMI
ncbi:MAG: 3-oxoacyl-[acyl-carrier-protein] reductase [Alphaproteobacteria bacterium]|jgi:3-oxoacyl-[acyl-carrier protein] reductase|nr:3-oxoacyl-[acyl-carrier-protein] reductase [Alphaproteobacteria bacterium]PPR13516.1 MAG: 3-oxoacyl-[acyl-carrier-protein] reductase FabG [Alphaproteobacteria bacterium MarineAlpha12_Bin1]|tara:strand:- start:1373 stop:2110 length:738 start_codon:yes stop_codon:yes gene_type:complete